MIAAGAGLGPSRTGAAARRVGADPAVRVAAPRTVAAGTVVLGVLVGVDPELTLELGDEPLVLGAEPGERIASVLAGARGAR